MLAPMLATLMRQRPRVIYVSISNKTSYGGLGFLRTLARGWMAISGQLSSDRVGDPSRALLTDLPAHAILSPPSNGKSRNPGPFFVEVASQAFLPFLNQAKLTTPPPL